MTTFAYGYLDTPLKGETLTSQLLPDNASQYEDGLESGHVLYTASFKEFEKNFLNYETMQWLFISLLLIPAWGIGIIMLLYTPVRRYVMKQDFCSRTLTVTTNAIIYKVKRPVFIPCLGESKMENCILLPLITDIVIEQGCLESAFGIHTIRITTLGQGRLLTAYDIQISGLVDPRAFRKVVLSAAVKYRQDAQFLTATEETERLRGNEVAIQGSHFDGVNLLQIKSHLQNSSDPVSSEISYPLAREASFTSGDTVLRKVEDWGNVLKRIEILVESQQQQT